jgi:hypothetical protein
MITGYDDGHKPYRSVNVNTNQWSFSRDVIVDKEARPFKTSSKIKITRERPIVAKDSVVNVQVAPP